MSLKPEACCASKAGLSSTTRSPNPSASVTAPSGPTVRTKRSVSIFDSAGAVRYQALGGLPWDTEPHRRFLGQLNAP